MEEAAPSPSKLEGGQRVVVLVAESEKLGDNDACLDWLRRKHASLFSATESSRGGTAHKAKGDNSLGKVDLSALENDVKACDSLRWSRFSFPSDPHRPLRSNYNNETGNPTPVRVRVESAGEEERRGGDGGGGHGPVRVILASNKKGKGTGKAPRKGEASAPSAASALDREPSRSILREIVLKRDVERQLRACPVPGSFGGGAPRPALGGYVAAPQRRDALRFLAFPQWDHSLFSGPGTVTAAGPGDEVARQRAETPQEVPFYLRGSVVFPIREHLPLGEVEESVDPSMEAEARSRDTVTRVNVAGACKLPVTGRGSLEGMQQRSASPWLSALVSRMWSCPGVVGAKAYTNQSRAERRYAPASGKVERRTLVEDGLCVAVYGANPRYGTSFAATRATVENSHRRYRGAADGKRAGDDDTIMAFTLTDAYDSAVQSSTSSSRLLSGAKYRVRWRAGPGIEHCSSDERSTTVFAKLSSESWVEWPVTVLKRQLRVKLRNQSCFMRPLRVVPTTADADSAASTREEDGHEYLWATQGPKWDPKLLRGFDNDYSNMHHSRNWYSAFSVEVSRKTAKASRDDESGGGHSAGPGSKAYAQAFANACFVDSFREYPRASVGFSITSDIPRLTVDAFNKLIPHTFECSFSWFVAFREGRLRSGLQPMEQPESAQYMRLSPVETFRHMKCGLTWKL